MEKDEEQTRYEYIAHQINREDGLVNNRFTWTLQLNGFLFAALAFYSKDVEPAMKVFFRFALPATGFAVSLAGVFGVLAAYQQLRYLIDLWNAKPDQRWPRPFGEPLTHHMSKLPSVGLLVLLAIVWLVLLANGLYS